MAARSLGLALAAAAAADAFLLPPSMSAEGVEPDLSTWTLVDPNSHLLIVPCQGCKVDGSADDSNLLLNLTVGAQPGTIELGGEVVYPVDPFDMHSNPKVLEVAPDTSVADIIDDMAKYSANEDVITGWMFGSFSEKISDAGDEILTVSLDIQSIGSGHVTVPHVEFKILKNPENHMMILSSSYTEFEPGTTSTEECTTAFCSFRQAIKDRLDRLSGIAASFPKGFRPGCHKGKGAHKGTRPPVNLHHGPNSHHDGANRQPLYEDGKFKQGHKPFRGHHGHRLDHHAHHNKFHRFMHRFYKLFIAVALPIVIGIVAGVLTYAIGMVIGCSIALIWIKFRRGGRRGYDSVALDEDDVVTKEVDIHDTPRESFESAPPVYEHAPAYEEKEQP